MKHIYFLAFLFLLFGEAISQDYILTLDNKRITGEVSTVFYSDYKNDVLFINDYGDQYYMQPQRIRGFAFKYGEAVFRYESKLIDGVWCFVEVVYNQGGIALYKSANSKDYVADDHGDMIKAANRYGEYWIQSDTKKLNRVNRLNYKKKLKRAFFQFPDLAAKVGKSGYKFKHLEDMVREYDRLWVLARTTI